MCGIPGGKLFAALGADLLKFRITALFENLFARVPFVRHAAQIFKPPCTTKFFLRPPNCRGAY